MKSKNERRLGGKGLSLHAFANAKSGSSGYNPALIKKQRELYRNAKIVKKFKRSIKRETWSRENLPSSTELENADENENEAKRSKKMTQESHSNDQFHAAPEDVDENPHTAKRPTRKSKKNKNSLESIRKDFEKRQAEKEKEELERKAIIKAKEEERAKAEAKRKVQREKMLKKTRSGQPVMKYRIEHLLDLARQ